MSDLKEGIVQYYHHHRALEKQHWSKKSHQVKTFSHLSHTQQENQGPMKKTVKIIFLFPVRNLKN